MLRRLRDVLLGVRSRVAVALAIGLLVFAGVSAARSLGLLVPLELGSYDLFHRWLQRDEGPSQRVALVWVREEEIQRFGHPLPDHLLARALAAILEREPRAVGVDIYRDRPVGEGIESLRETVGGDRRVVMVEKLPDRELPAVAPPPFLTADQIGFSDMIRDPGGVARRGLLLLWDEEGTPHLSLSLQLATRYLEPEGIGLASDPERPEFIRLGPTTLPPFEADFGGYRGADAGGYQFLVDFRSDPRDLASITLSELLDGDFDPDVLGDRVVIVGTRSPSVKDAIETPLSAGLRDRGETYGAALHAHAVDQLLRYALGITRPVRAPEGAGEAVWLLAGCLAGGLLGIATRSLLASALVAGVGLLALLGAGAGALTLGWWVPIAPTAIGGIGSLGLAVAYVSQQERREKAMMRVLFGRFVSRDVVTQIWSQRSVFMEGGRPVPQRAPVTVMMSDLSGYTTASEKLDPAAVMDWIGGYMEAMAHLVETHGGIVNDFVGDGLMATFGVPVVRTEDPDVDRDSVNAVSCALAMESELARLNAAWQASGSPTGRLRVGILTGEAVVGTLGSEEHSKYATVGDVVNTAARLESFKKEAFEADVEESSCRILVGDATWQRLGDRFEGYCLGAHMLKGKGRPVTIYRVLGRREGAGSEDPEKRSAADAAD